jgi:hypothetical protein
VIPEGKHPLIPTEGIHKSEHSDAGVNIISEVDDFGQTGTAFLDSASFLPFFRRRGAQAPIMGI